ncbi:MAG TPA: LacI family DNA-binding transcriptional regulator [Woeseiaceae bacterium]|nr:LacI family DNA-binding transcriptional regulator [Woeseiaceae bacterium]
MSHPSKRRPRRRRSAPTISDVARHAGVSPMTVSRVINNEANVREETRELVNSAIAELGYAPNEAARSLAGATQIHIALLFTNPSAAYLSEFLVGSLERARALNVQLLVEKCSDGDDADDAIRRLRAGGADGVLLSPPLADSPQVLKVLETTDTPAVIVTSSCPRDNISVVSIDDYEAALTMTRHIISLGHKRIGFIIGHPNQLASERRLAGYRAALAEAGLPHAPELEVQGLFTYRSGLEAADHLLNLEPMPTAIFASNDDMAAATVAVAHRRGLDVPGDLTVCGFDDTTLAVTIWPELTTIRQPIVELSGAAVELLVQKIKALREGNRQEARHVLLDFKLVRRQSDAPPRLRPQVNVAPRR